MISTPTTILGGMVAGLVLFADLAAARTWAGGVDMQQACNWQAGSGYTAMVAGNNAWSWICFKNEGDWTGVNVDAYCKQRYGNTAYADPQGGGPYDWGCYYP
ncbi:hypothetical protein B0T25DRAFT_633668 [Lasiosphaeria hispida]|uniref:Secreted protein n=1 Tax=Lasiosphaeria hispida TaxID=260671 RepID=A0AAJ0MAF3_9PEZI|nr:hypothetical protein B0T25DRAFT_633668 [Lasiosphaeria hispida]